MAEEQMDMVEWLEANVPDVPDVPLHTGPATVLVYLRRKRGGLPFDQVEFNMAALTSARDTLLEHGIADIRFPWECDLDDQERAGFEGLLAALRAYDVVREFVHP